VPCQAVLAGTRSKLEPIDRQIDELKSIRHQLDRILWDWSAKLARTPKGQRAGLLESPPDEMEEHANATHRGVCGNPGNRRRQRRTAKHHAGPVHRERVQRGDQAMGFSTAKTTHHFRLFANGGAIEVEVNNPKDAESLEQIRVHLSQIASMVADGDFNVPMFVHDTTPPGVPTMTKRKGEIHDQFEETPAGGRVRIVTQSAQALDAVHAFLLFQIIEHQTGDSASIAQSTRRKD
jgi:hypothetical protein